MSPDLDFNQQQSQSRNRRITDRSSEAEENVWLDSSITVTLYHRTRWPEDELAARLSSFDSLTRFYVT